MLYSIYSKTRNKAIQPVTNLHIMYGMPDSQP